MRLTSKRLAVLRSAAQSDTNVTLIRGARTKSGARYCAHGVAGDVAPQVEYLLEQGLLEECGRDGFWAPVPYRLTAAGRKALAGLPQ